MKLYNYSRISAWALVATAALTARADALSKAKNSIPLHQGLTIMFLLGIFPLLFAALSTLYFSSQKGKQENGSPMLYALTAFPKAIILAYVISGTLLLGLMNLWNFTTEQMTVPLVICVGGMVILLSISLSISRFVGTVSQLQKLQGPTRLGE